MAIEIGGKTVGGTGKATAMLTDADLLQRLAAREGQDAHRTAGRAALVSWREVDTVRPLVCQGLITIDETSAPVISSVEHGVAWAVFTDAGREALAAL